MNNASTLADSQALAADVRDYTPFFASAGLVKTQEGAASYLGTGVLRLRP